MFGSGKKKENDVRLTDKQMRDLTKNMSRSERKEFEKKQRRAQSDREWDAMMMGEVFFDDWF